MSLYKECKLNQVVDDHLRAVLVLCLPIPCTGC